MDIEPINKAFAKMNVTRAIKTLKFPTTGEHVLHVEESGNPKGIPTLFLHGGPGAGIGQNYFWPFDAEDHWLIAFDQRGCGLSQPFGSLEQNTTYDLVEDIEALRVFFKVDKWLLFGGSWGSTLALAYAIAYPHRVSGLILRGIFLGRPQDTNWFVSNKEGASQIFALEYATFEQDYVNATTTAQSGTANNASACTSNGEPTYTNPSLCEWYFEQLTHTSETVRKKAASAWFNWEGSISKLQQSAQALSDGASNQQVYSLALLECYYVLNNCFMPPNHILLQAHKLKQIPLYIVHGRYDMVCKCAAAIELHKAVETSTLTIVEDAGHSMTESGISKALTQALAQVKRQLQQGQGAKE